MPAMVLLSQFLQPRGRVSSGRRETAMSVSSACVPLGGKTLMLSLNPSGGGAALAHGYERTS